VRAGVAVWRRAVYGLGPSRVEDFMPNIGFSELIVILLILTLVFGGSRLPALGEAMGKAIRSFKRGVAQNEDIEVTGVPSGEADKPGKQVGSGAARAGQVVSDAEIIEEKKS
jgi:sec-independent protein translocase protein TatA